MERDLNGGRRCPRCGELQVGHHGDRGHWEQAMSLLRETQTEGIAQNIWTYILTVLLRILLV